MFLFADRSLLKTIEGSHLDCVVKTHPALLSVMHLLPENVVVSGNENIPGLVASPAGKTHNRKGQRFSHKLTLVLFYNSLDT